MNFIYCILNKSNGKIYVGQTNQGEHRFYQHKYSLNKNKHSNPHLQSAWNKYGENAFEFNVLEHCDESKLNDNEEWWIDYFNSTNSKNGYNLESGGKSNYRITDETRKRMSLAQKGEKSHCYGKTYSNEHRMKIREAKLGDKNPMYGKKRPLETLLKQSHSTNTSGYFRVHKSNDKSCTQGFLWIYQYYDENNKKQRIRSIDIDKLKKKVIEKGLEWYEF